MSFWTAIVILAAIFAYVAITRSRNQGQPGSGEIGPSLADAQRQAELQRELEELRERVKVLERIAIDEREAKRISAEIDRLRDQR